jgi:regulatory protein
MAVDLRNKALKLLSLREHSRSELRRKLAGVDDATHDDDIEALLDDFEQRGWLSDARFAASYISANGARFGKQRLAAELRQRGVSDSDTSAALANWAEEADPELARARAIWTRKYDGPGATPVDRAKQARFLQSRGFGYDVIRKVISGLDDE